MCFQHEIVTKSNHYLLGQKEMELSQVRGSAQPRWLPSEVKSFQISFKARASVCFAQANDLKWRSTISEFQAFSSQSCCIFISVSRGQISYWYDYYFSILLLLQNPWHVHLQGIKLAKNEKIREQKTISFLLITSHGSAQDQSQFHKCIIQGIEVTTPRFGIDPHSSRPSVVPQ